MSVRVMGTCSKCGGMVTIPTIWHGIYPPTPSCRGCGATPKNAHGPVIQMGEPKRWRRAR